MTIRTFDLGADKHMEGVSAGLDRVTMNPALGLRAVRFCLAEPQLFLTQLRAILRASHHGKIKILIPMLCNVTSSTRCSQLIERAKESLRDDRITLRREHPGRRHDRDPGGGARRSRHLPRGSISCRSAPTT